MLNKIIPAVIVLVGAGIGGFAANMLTSPSAPAEASTVDGGKAEKDDHGKKDDHGDGHGKKKDSAKKGKGKSGDGYGDSGATTYFKFSREFIVPMMSDNSIESLVILNINIEVDSGSSSSLFSMEPKLRDNIMTSLIELSNDGVTMQNITDIESYETIRSVVKKNLKKIAPDAVKNVLILDVAKQEL